MGFDGKRILVTGGSRGIGQAAVIEFLRQGAHVALNGRTEAAAVAGIATLDGDPGHIFAAPGDVATRDGCYAIVERAVADLGGLDVLVNSAGIGHSGPFADVDEAMWDATIDINLKGTFFCCQAAAPHLKASRGNIVNVASDAGLIGETGLSAYCASKGGVVNLTRALALELAPDVRVNCVCPGYTDTDMVRRDGIEQAADPKAAERDVIEYAPLKRIALPREIGRGIAYLAGADAIFVTGATLQIDGGSTAGNIGPG
jgi:NAD(P)-dependent dehydrogenase (short-subunit alcohol dehydrogenase family)